MTRLKKNLGLLLALGWLSIAMAQILPQPASGRIDRLSHFPSRHVDARHVDVWLPDNFDALEG